MQRRDQIIAATLNLLSDTPLDSLTTRQISRAVGISQPALFRHFRSRDDLIAAVITHARQALAADVQAVLEGDASPLDRAEAAARHLLRRADQQPGLPRLLFSGSGQRPAHRTALRQLVDMQRALVAELVRQAQKAGQAPPEVDPRGAAILLVALIQGVLLQRQVDGDACPITETADALLSLWRAGISAGAPASQGAQPEPPAQRGPALQLLDVRPILASGRDPLTEILSALETLPDSGLLILHAPFRPAPLLTLLEGRGHPVHARQDGDTWIVGIRGARAPEPVDLRDLPAPEPLEHALRAIRSLAPGQPWIGRLPRVPRLLLPRITDADPLVIELADGTALLHVRGPESAR